MNSARNKALLRAARQYWRQPKTRRDLKDGARGVLVVLGIPAVFTWLTVVLSGAN